MPMITEPSIEHPGMSDLSHLRQSPRQAEHPGAALVTSYPPRQCGIASYARDLRRSLAKNVGRLDVVALHGNGAPTAYGPEVKHVLASEDLRGFRKLGRTLSQHYEIVLLQHEFGLFGGEAGRNIIDFTESWSGRLIVTLHTVLPAPALAFRTVMQHLCDSASSVVVMCDTARQILASEYLVESDRIHVVPNGTDRKRPSSPTSQLAKSSLGLASDMVFVSAGFITPNKGIEYGLQAFAQVAKGRKNVKYAIVGQSHPCDDLGRSYVSHLRSLIEKLGLAEQARLVLAYVSDMELDRWLLAADLCVLPYLEPRQVSSGILTRCMGLGRRIVSTDFPYAREVLSNGDGWLVPMRDPSRIAQVMESVISRSPESRSVGLTAFARSGDMAWREVAARYVQLLRTTDGSENDSADRSPHEIAAL
jgi:glycosyltransferase involved in cell wall biosynthesis